jgi:peroxiredoxin
MQPFFNQLARAYAPSVGFLGVIDRQSEEARSWGRANQVPFPILADPDLAIVRAYGASNSAYVALIDKRHQIEKFWPGVSEGMLDDLNQRLARLAGIEPRPIDASEAPEDLYSGCPFDL